MADIQNIYSILQSRGYQERLFSRLTGARKKEGREIRVDCPICHSEGNFSYSTEKPLWKCWSCGAGGDWLDFMEKVEGKSSQIALQELASVAGVELSPHSQEAYKAYTRKADILEDAQELFKKELEDQIRNDGAVIVYLADRGYSLQEALDMELGAYTSRKALQEYLRGKGYTEKEIKDSGLLSSGFGEDYQLAFLWRDASGRAIGMVGRSILSGDELKDRGIPKYKYSYGMQKDQGLIGFTSARGSEQIVLLEGVLDALYLNNKGFKSVAVGGTSLSASQLEALQLAGCKEILLAMDMDEAGQRATEKLIKSLTGSSLRAYVVSLPDGFKDADELIRERGAEAFQEAVKQAQRWPSWLARRIISRHEISTDRGMDKALEEAVEVYSQIDDAILKRGFSDSLEEATGLTEEELAGRLDQASQMASRKRTQAVLESQLQDIQKKAEAGDLIGTETGMEKALREIRTVRGLKMPEPYSLEGLTGDILEAHDSLKTGWDNLDRIAKIPAGALTIIAGRPGQGKTTFQLNLLSNLLQLYPDKRFYYFSYEESRMAIALKLIMIEAGVILNQNSNYEAYINYMKTKRGSQETSDRRIEHALERYEKLTLTERLLLCDDMYPVDDLATVISLLDQRGDTGAVIVDYIQRISPGESQSQRYLDIKLISSRLLDRAVKLGIPIILGAQLKRATESNEPRLDNLRESGDIEQDANLVLSLYTPAIEEMEKSENDYRASQKVDMEVSILKNRGGASGRKITLRFNRPVLKISDN